MSKIVKKPTLPERFQKFLSLGLWAPEISLPDPQILERIQRLNDDIEEQILQLYLQQNQINETIRKYKEVITSSSRVQVEQREDATDWSEFTKKNFTHLGKGVSHWLNHREEETDKLTKSSLPSIPDAQSLASLLDISIPKIKWLAYHRKFTSTRNYHQFKVKKASGGFRLISKPASHILGVQNRIKSKILDRLKMPFFLFGFIEGRSSLDNAKEHARNDLIVNIDILNYFDHIRFPQVRSAFHDQGYSGEISTVLALLVTHQLYTPVTIDDQTYWACSTFRSLPQGAPTSPMVSNLVGLKFDQQLYKRSQNMGFSYTRYADDLTFSGKINNSNLSSLLYMARKTLELHGFEANPNKTKVHYPHNRQEITGYVVNSNSPKVSRKWRRRLRAAVHQFRFIEDPEEKEEEYTRIMGCIQYLKQSSPQKAKLYEIEVNRYFKLRG